MLGRTSLIATAGALVLAPAAHAQLPLPLPDGTGTVDQVTGLVGGLAPAAPGPVQDALDTLLNGGVPTLDPGVLDGLLGAIGAPPGGARTGTPTAGGAAGGVVGSGVSGGIVDGRAPTVSVQVLSHLRTVRKTGRLVLRVGASEPAVVALAGTVRPGKQLRAKKQRGAREKARAAASFRRPIQVKRALLAFRRQGALRVTISLSRTAQRRLGRARDARLSLAVYAVDVARNQAVRQLKRHVKR
jgi:hypothetical protein